jgi:hypothetical protein
VMIGMLRAGETSPKIYLGALTIAIELEEPEFYSEIRKLLPLEKVTGVFAPWLKALDLNLRVRSCRSSAEMVKFEFLQFIYFWFRTSCAQKFTEDWPSCLRRNPRLMQCVTLKWHFEAL